MQRRRYKKQRVNDRLVLLRCNANTREQLETLRPIVTSGEVKWTDVEVRGSELVPTGAVDLCWLFGGRARVWLNRLEEFHTDPADDVLSNGEKRLDSGPG